MAREGALPLAEGTRRVPPSRSLGPRAPRDGGPSFVVERDDEWVEGYRVGLSASLRRRLRGTPTATLDLHRHDSETARRLVARFLESERANGRELVLVVVGRGLHSPGGRGVLREEIADWLTAAPTAAHVLAFRTASREHGGSGGLVVLLARAPERARRA